MTRLHELLARLRAGTPTLIVGRADDDDDRGGKDDDRGRSRDDDRRGAGGDDDRGKGRDDDRGKGRDDDDDDDRGSGRPSKYERELRKESAGYRRRAKEAESKLEDLEAELADLRERLDSDGKGGKGVDERELERRVTKAVRDRESELKAGHARELAKLHVAVLAAGRLEDPDDVALLDLDELAELADDPRALRRAAGDAIDDLLERKPYLARGGKGDDDDDDRGKRRRSLADTVTAGSRGRERDDDRGKGGDDDWLRKAARS